MPFATEENKSWNITIGDQDYQVAITIAGRHVYISVDGESVFRGSYREDEFEYAFKIDDHDASIARYQRMGSPNFTLTVDDGQEDSLEQIERVPLWTWIFIFLSLVIGFIGFFSATYVFPAVSIYLAWHTYQYNKLKDAVPINKLLNSIGLLGINLFLMLLFTILRIFIRDTFSI